MVHTAFLYLTTVDSIRAFFLLCSVEQSFTNTNCRHNIDWDVMQLIISVFGGRVKTKFLFMSIFVPFDGSCILVNNIYMIYFITVFYDG